MQETGVLKALTWQRWGVSGNKGEIKGKTSESSLNPHSPWIPIFVFEHGCLKFLIVVLRLGFEKDRSLFLKSHWWAKYTSVFLRPRGGWFKASQATS